MKVMGFKDTVFDFPKENKQVKGMTLFLSEERKNVTGLACESVFVSDGKLDGYKPKLGDSLNVNYNKYGKVRDIAVA